MSDNMKKLLFYILIGCLLTSCSAIASSPTPTNAPSITPLPSATSTSTPTPTSTPTTTNTPTITLTPTPSITPSPTLTPTPFGGGNGFIAFTGWGEGGSDLFTYDLSSREEKRITNLDGHESILSVSPDGEWLLFTEWVVGHQRISIYFDILELHIVRTDGSDLQKISSNFIEVTDYESTSALWTKDSSKVIFIESDGSNERYLSAYNITDGTSKRITKPGRSVDNIGFISNDDWIYWTEGYGAALGYYNIGDWKSKIDGSETEQLRSLQPCTEFYCGRDWAYDPNSDLVAFYPNYSEGREGVIFSSEVNGGEGSILMKLNPSKENCKFKVFSVPYQGPIAKLEWSPNGKYLVIPYNTCHVYIWNREENSIKKIPYEKIDNFKIYWNYSWSPDSSKIIFGNKFGRENIEATIYDILTGEITTIDIYAYAPKWVP